MCLLPDRPPCTSLSADPSSNTSLVVLNNVLHAIRQVNKQHRGPSTSNWDQGAEDAPRQDLWEGTCGGSMRSCDEAPDEGVVYIFLRWDKWGGPAVNPPLGLRLDFQKLPFDRKTKEEMKLWGESYFIISGPGLKVSRQSCSFMGETGDFQYKWLRASVHVHFWLFGQPF